MKSVVVTGASSGIGWACALDMDRAGWRVFAGVRRQEDAARLRQAGSERMTPIPIDVTDGDSIASAAAEVERVVGAAGLHGLVNNAGVSSGGVLEFMDLDDLRTVLEVNVVGQLAVTQPLIPLLRRARGRIVMMSSIAGRSASPLIGPYCASKFALEALTDALRIELHPWGIEVIAVEPGMFSTQIQRKTLDFAEQVRSRYPPAAQELYGPLIEMMYQRLQRPVKAQPVDVARVVNHALTAEKPRTRYLVGKNVRLRIWIERLPDRLRDRFFLSRLPAYGSKGSE